MEKLTLKYCLDHYYFIQGFTAFVQTWRESLFVKVRAVNQESSNDIFTLVKPLSMKLRSFWALHGSRAIKSTCTIMICIK